MISVKIRKEILYSYLNGVLKSKGYKLINTGEDPCYLLKEDNQAQFLVMNFLRAGSMSLGLYLTIHEVEDIIIDIGEPNRKNMNLFLKKEKYFLPTFKDIYLQKIMNDKYHLYSFKSEEEFIEFTKWICTYLENKGIHFIEHYSFLPNLLSKMDELTSHGRFWADILHGQVDNIFRGLIISKLCEDSNFGNKLKYWDEMLHSKPNLVEWFPYFDKLKEKLNTIEPKYDASKGKIWRDEGII